VDPLQLPAAPAASDSAGQTGIATEAADADRADALARISVHAPLVLEADRLQALKALAKECGTTLYAVLLAVQSIALARLTGADRIPVSVPMHGRSSGTHRAVDFLVSTVPLPLDTATGTVRDLVGSAGHALRGALAHHGVGYPELVALSAAENGPDIPAPDAALL
ncbi:condensation domain-containing protein, partial [Streptomyces sp. T-3]|nr:condensation domain-containing protein [Streptomyces sp. T-3]